MRILCLRHATLGSLVAQIRLSKFLLRRQCRLISSFLALPAARILFDEGIRHALLRMGLLAEVEGEGDFTIAQMLSLHVRPRQIRNSIALSAL